MGLPGPFLRRQIDQSAKEPTLTSAGLPCDRFHTTAPKAANRPGSLLTADRPRNDPRVNLATDRRSWGKPERLLAILARLRAAISPIDRETAPLPTAYRATVLPCHHYPYPTTQR